MGINEFALLLIKQFVIKGLYIYKYQTVEYSNNPRLNMENDKTYLYILEKGVTPKLLAETVIQNLKVSECYKTDQDENEKFGKGIVYFFKTRQFGDELYVKVKLPDDISKLLIFSIHKDGIYD